MAIFDPVDDWFSSAFSKKSKPSKKSRRASASGGGGVKFSKYAKEKNIISVIRRAPEVMVKITGNSTGLKTLKNHLDYISRNGQLELTTENGESLQGKGAIKDLRDQFKAAQIPNESQRREFLHVMFSMPAGTPKNELRESVLQFCAEEFSTRHYVAALHDDKDHTHVHVCVSTRAIDFPEAPRLNPRKADLFRWRQGFADKLRENGIEAAASKRSHRFNYRKPENFVSRQILTHNKALGENQTPRKSTIFEAQKKQLLHSLQAGKRPINPLENEIKISQKNTYQKWNKVLDNLNQAGKEELANSLADLIKNGKNIPKSFLQELYDRAEHKIKEQEQSL